MSDETSYASPVVWTSPPRYPRTPHWPWSETVHVDDSYHQDPAWFVGKEVVVGEKLDGGCTCLWNGNVYARSTSAPASDGWFGMVKKHHVWKSQGLPSTIAVYGEDIFGVHSITYDPVREDQTFYLFAVRSDDTLLSWDGVELMAGKLTLPLVPVVFRGVFDTVEAITAFFKKNLSEPSQLGPTREGFVIRLAQAFPVEDFALSVCKYVRANHVQTDQHWRINWQPCKLK